MSLYCAAGTVMTTPPVTSTVPPALSLCSAACQAAFQVTVGGDYSGTNINPGPNNVISASDCQNRCYSNAACLTFTWTGGGGESSAYFGTSLGFLPQEMSGGTHFTCFYVLLQPP